MFVVTWLVEREGQEGEEDERLSCCMSPTSLANHRLSITSTRNNKLLLSTRSTPPIHGTVIFYLRTLSRRAPSLLLFLLLACIYLLWHTQHTTRRLNYTAPFSAKSPSYKSLQFAPTQVKRTSVKIKYSQGSAQEIFAPSIREDDTVQTLWQSDVVGVEIPLGAIVTLGGGELEREVELEAGGSCSEGACRGAKRASVRHDLLKGLRQMREAGEVKFGAPPFPPSRR